MEKLKLIEERGVSIGFAFWCPGCEMHHLYYVPRWSFNGSMERPTFTPSLLNTWEHGPSREPRRCHLFVTDGRIDFCSDCTHSLAGKSVDMPPHQF
jgi:hypothetical protein